MPFVNTLSESHRLPWTFAKQKRCVHKQTILPKIHSYSSSYKLSLHLQRINVKGGARFNQVFPPIIFCRRLLLGKISTLYSFQMEVSSNKYTSPKGLCVPLDETFLHVLIPLFSLCLINPFRKTPSPLRALQRPPAPVGDTPISTAPFTHSSHIQTMVI